MDSGMTDHGDKVEIRAENEWVELRPITRDLAFDYIKRHHRHHDVPVGGLWWHGAQTTDGLLAGVAVVGRPVARALDDGLTCEVTRLCTDGTQNACSLLYGATKRAAEAKGFRRGITYILASESGASLRAAGWKILWTVRGRSWNCESRPRVDKHPTEDKQAWGWGAWASSGGHTDE
jgi:hypothetical protein